MSLSKYRILYAEDHADTQELVQFVLNGLNYDVVITSSCEDTLSRAKGDKFDLYLIDTMLPDGSGVELCKEIREFDGATPILFYSAMALDSEKRIALDSGAQGYLTKPATPVELSGAISKLLMRMTVVPEECDAEVSISG